MHWLSGRDLRVLLIALAVPGVVVGLATAIRRVVLPLVAVPPLQSERVVAGLVVVALLAVALPFHRAIRAAIVEFFAATAHPANLGLFRIAVFLALFADFSVSRTVWFSELPAVLMFPPVGTGVLLRYLPVDATWATVAAVLLRVTSVTGAIGLASRFSAASAAVLGVYVFGIPQLYGKVVHEHHLLWFAALLAASPCGDALSIDAILAARKRSGSGWSVPRAARAYALPLRFVWLLVGIVYFFPGLWKACSGIDWVVGDNLSNLMRLSRFREGHALTWHADQHPVLSSLGGAGTLFFELSFVVLIFSSRLRSLALAAALIFHNLTRLLLGISFWSLQTCLLALPDWHRILARAREREHPREDARASHVDVATASRARPVIAVGVVLVAVNTVFGVLGITAAWPFACYPRFSHVAEAETRRIAFTIESTGGATRDIYPSAERALTRYSAQSRLVGLEDHILASEDPDTRHARLRAYWTVWMREDPRARDATAVRVYVDTLTTVPERAAENPIRHELIDTLTP